MSNSSKHSDSRSHHHAHHHHHHGESDNLKVAFFLNLAFTVVELFGGLYVNSVAILSDAIHDLGDSLSLGVAWYLQKKSSKPANDQFSFGYRRYSLLGALISSVVLITGSVFIIYEAFERLINPEASNATGMLLFALLGVAVNGYAAWRMSKGKNMNERLVSWHLLEDVLGWTAVLIVSIVLHFKQIDYLDPALSLFITLYVLWNVIQNLRETLFLFLQGKPKEIDRQKLEQQLLQIDKVHSLHHTHIWSLDGEHHVFTTHVKMHKVDHFKEVIALKSQIKNLMKAYSFSHYTIETEFADEQCTLE